MRAEANAYARSFLINYVFILICAVRRTDRIRPITITDR